jgi:hypothetical protein
MTIAEAIHLAIAGGYHLTAGDGGDIVYSGANNEYAVWTRTDTQSSFLVPVQATFLDPAFWHALGYALGWEPLCTLASTCVQGDAECRRWHGTAWMYQWHCFIQHLAEGYPPDAFFARLLHPSAPRRLTRRARGAGRQES